MCLPLPRHRWKCTRDKFETRPRNGFAKQGTTVPHIISFFRFVGHKCWYSHIWSSWCSILRNVDILRSIGFGAWVIFGTRIDVPLVLARASCAVASCCWMNCLYSTTLRFTNIAGEWTMDETCVLLCSYRKWRICLLPCWLTKEELPVQESLSIVTACNSNMNLHSLTSIVGRGNYLHVLTTSDD